MFRKQNQNLANSTKKSSTTLGQKVVGLLHTIADLAEDRLKQAKTKVGETLENMETPKIFSNNGESAKNKSQGKRKKKNSNGKKANSVQSEQTEASLANPTAVIPNFVVDPAHAPGHQKLDVKSEFGEPTGRKRKTQKSAVSRNAADVRTKRMTSPQRRINSPNRVASKRGNSMPKSASHH